ncbi:MAG: lamin tail domain-containing protein [Planctomycetota bacterium]
MRVSRGLSWLGFAAVLSTSSAVALAQPAATQPGGGPDPAPAGDPEAAPGVVITELMYNPISGEGYQPDPETEPDRRAIPNRVEYVELYNAGDRPVDLRGWRLRDEDGSTGPIPPGPPMPPGGVVLLIPHEQLEADFRAAWGLARPTRVVRLTAWGPEGLNNLANSPSDKNEILDLVASDGVLVDRVNYDDDSPWPADGRGGPSIYLLPTVFGPNADPALSNDDGTAWRNSADGVLGGRTAQSGGFYRQGDVGSPGFVPAKAPESSEAEAPAPTE